MVMRKIKLNRGKLANLPQLELGEPAVATDDGSLHIGTEQGNVKLAKDADVQAVSQQLAEKATKGQITGEDLSTASDLGKIKLVNLADEVHQALTGNAPALTVIEDGSVTLEKLGFAKVTRINLYDDSKATVGYYVSNTTGALVKHTSDYYRTTDFIPVKPNTHYYIDAQDNIAFYNADKTFVVGQGGGWNSTYPDKVYPVPDNPDIAFMRVTIRSEKSGSTMIAESATPLSYVPYSQYSTEITDTSLKNEINRITLDNQKKMSRLYGLKWNVLGDSITFGQGASGYPYHRWISDRTGITVNNYGISMSTVSDMVDNVSGKDPSEYNPMVFRYANMADDADIITVLAGVNDKNHGAPLGTFGDTGTHTFYGALDTMIVGLLNKYPTKRIGYILPPFASTELPGLLDMDGRERFIDAIKQVCKKHAVPVLDLYTASQMGGRVPARRSALIPDGLHPSKEGHRIISTAIEQFLLSL